jgi:CRP/FNR family transcriptional regulator
MTVFAQPEKAACQHCMMETICTHLPGNLGNECKLNPVVKLAQNLKRKELLYSYHDPFKCIFVVSSGTIKTFQIDMNGQERIQNFYLPGEVIGLEAIQTGFYPYSAIAVTASTVCEIPFDNLLDFVADIPALQKHIITTLGYRINQGHYVTAPSAEQRLAAFIIDMSQRLNHDNTHPDIELPMSRYDIGNYLGLAPETISRIFTRFQQAKLLHVQQKRITLTNPSKLQWIAKDGIQAGA